MRMSRLLQLPLLGFVFVIPLSLAAVPQPRTDFYTNSGAAYDFYLNWTSPRIKPKSPRIIPFLTFKRSGGKSQVA
jgi:hypothetical protein